MFSKSIGSRMPTPGLSTATRSVSLEMLVFVSGVMVGTLLGVVSALFVSRRSRKGTSPASTSVNFVPQTLEIKMPSSPPAPLAKPVPLTRPRLKRLGNEAQDLALLESYHPLTEAKPEKKSPETFVRYHRDEKSLELAKIYLSQMVIVPPAEPVSLAAAENLGPLAQTLKVLEAAKCGGKPYSNTQYGEFMATTTPHAYFYIEILSELAGSDYILTFRYLRVTRVGPDLYEYVEGKDRTLIVHPAD